jgi:SPP1 family predicted phage head-tail adaptor
VIAGRMDMQVVLQRPTVTQGAAGQAVEAWTDVATIWAGRRDARGSEYFAAMARQAETETLFTVRYRADIISSWRLTHDGLIWDIRSVAMIGRREGLELRCTAFVPGEG